MTPTRAVFTVAQPDGTTIRVACQPNTGLHDRTDKLLGEALHLIELLRQPEVGRHLLELAYTHPGRDQLTHFQATDCTSVMSPTVPCIALQRSRW